MTNMKVLLNGSGLIAHILSEQLKEQGHQVVQTQTASHTAANRIVMLNPRSQAILAGKQLLPEYVEVHDIAVEDELSTGNFKLKKQPGEQSLFGVCLNEKAIHEMLPAQPTFPAIQSIDLHDHGVNAHIDSQEQAFDLLINTERQANELVGAKQLPKLSKPCFVLTGTLQVETSTPNLAFQIFTQFGPIGLLPQKQHEDYTEYSIIWSFRRREDAEYYEQCVDLEILNLLNPKVRRHMHIRSAVMAKAISIGFSRSIHRHARVMLMGKALSTLHPLSGQGLNLSLGQISSFCELTSQSLCDPATVKSKWLKKFGWEHVLVDVGSEVTLAAFSTNHPWIKWGRARAMGTVNFVPKLQRQLVKLVSGDYHQAR